jgi:nicotinamide-nucleotide amidase
MKTEIIPVGTEILLGNIVDTDSSFLANQLSMLGIDLYFISAVGDNQERLVDTLKRAWERADLIIVTGGLGPTQDDITREAIGRLLGEELQVDRDLWEELQGLLKQYAGKIPPSNVRQAATIRSAQIVRNRMGTAPGWWVEKDGRIVIALPGPPDEMQLMWQEGVLPRLRERVTGEIILSRTIKTFRLAEAAVDELVAPLSQLSNPTVATYINPDGVHLRITAKARRREEAEELLSRWEHQVRQILSSHIWGVDEDTLASVIGELLKARNITLATMESATEGLLCNTIASGCEGSACFAGGLTVCSDRARAAWGIEAPIKEQPEDGGVEVARAMADAARTKLDADIGLGVDGALNLDANSGRAFIAITGDRIERTHIHTLRGGRSRMKQRAVYAALFDLRHALLEEDLCT